MIAVAKKIFCVEKETTYVVSPFFDFFCMMFCAAFASAIVSVGIFAFESFDRAVSREGMLAFSAGIAAFWGPFIAFPFLVFLIFPWLEIVKIKDAQNFFVWVSLPVLSAPVYAFYAEDAATQMFKLEGALIIYTIAAFLTSSFLWMLNRSPQFRVKEVSADNALVDNSIELNKSE